MPYLKPLFFLLALILAYLFALNGRYTKIDSDLILDKWKQEIIMLHWDMGIRQFNNHTYPLKE